MKKNKKKKKNKLKKVLIVFGIILLVVIVVLLYKIYGTIFREVEVNNNKSVAYSNRLIQEVYDENNNSLVCDLTLNNNLAFFYSEGNDKVKNELKTYLNTDKDTLINNYNNIYKRYRFANRRVAYGNSLWINNNTDDCSKESKETARKLNFDIKNRDFNNNTKNEINNWIKKKSHGKVNNAIEDDIDNIQSILVSTLYFNEKWMEEYEDEDIETETFHGTKGDTKETFLYSEEEIYLEDTTSKGFMKPYKDEGLYFIGIIPKENYTIKDINIESLMNSRKNTKVNVSIPEFEYEQTIDLKDLLSKMSINNIFKPGNLDSIAKDLYVYKFIQKNYIKVDRTGTEAFSVTFDLNMQWGAISSGNYVYLDEPFVFMIYDDTIDQVLFIGNVNNIK